MMFGELKKYLDEDFYNAHKTIEFNTLYERGVYEVIEVGLSEVQYQDEMYSGIIISECRFRRRISGIFK